MAAELLSPLEAEQAGGALVHAVLVPQVFADAELVGEHDVTQRALELLPLVGLDVIPQASQALKCLITDLANKATTTMASV